MSAGSCEENVSIPLRNLLNSVQCIRDRVRDEEPNQSDGEFNLPNFWDTLNQAAKAVSQEATKLSVAFSKSPFPSLQNGEKLAESTLNSVLTLSTMYYWLPKSQGLILRGQVKDATVAVLQGVTQLLEAILSSPLQSLNSVSQEQLTSTGGVWAACDHFVHLPRDNKAAVLVVLSSQVGVVKDAIDEIQQALSDAENPSNDEFDDDNDPGDDQDVHWSARDRLVIGPCQGLMKASAACIRKLTSAVKTNGDFSDGQNVAQLDQLAHVSKEISPCVDELALCLYPPMEYSDVESNAFELAALLKNVLGLIRSSHVCGESELTWVQFLDGAVDHNLQKARDLIQQDSL
ncbi:cyclin-D1-binding protein 1 homolog [Gouania willdenowi]|uniref:Cyclin D-type binding-protein 1 n=1 Tax=Gouania willdenowi TaxID=441366 RepID=A0A8C5G551_GOUWI|nr:cyclin-D1-binding protein 1 [Gouania willdenowi]